MKVLIAISFCLSVVFLVYQALQSNLLLAAVGGYLVLAFLLAFAGSIIDVRICENTSEVHTRIREEAIISLQKAGLGNSLEDLVLTLLLSQLGKQARIYGVTVALLIVSGLIFRQLESILAHAIFFGVLNVLLQITYAIGMVQHRQQNRPS